MTEEQKEKRKIKLEFDELSLWRIGTILFAVLFIISIVTGGFRGGSQEDALPSPTNPQNLPPEPGIDAKIDLNEDDDPVKGDAKAPVTLIEYSDFQCPFCGRAFTQTLPQIEENFVKKGKVKLVFRDLPLAFHPEAHPAAEAAECADEQGKFWAYHDLLFKNQQELGTANYKKWAQEAGLDVSKFNSCFDAGKYKSEVDKDNADATKAGASGTPTFFAMVDKSLADVEALKKLHNPQLGLYYGESTDGKKVVFKIVGAQPFTSFEQVLNAELLNTDN